MTEITMPKLSDSMEEGTILTWLKSDGDSVEAGEDLVEIETDKATVTHPAEASGVLNIIANEGTSVTVGTPIARMGERDASPAPPPDDHDREPMGGSSAPAAAASNGHSPDRAENLDDGVKATPLARRIAMVHGVALEEVQGTGPLGRVTRGDVLAKAGLEPPARESIAAAPPGLDAPAPASGEGPRGPSEKVELTRIQRIVAQRMAATKATVPEFQVETEVVMDEAIDLRARLKAAGEVPPSLNDLIVKAAALALRRHPRANGSYRDGYFELHSRVNIGVAVAADDVLIVPTVFDADRKSLGAIAAESRRLAEQARAGKISPAELSGATFTVSNLGMYGMTAITPVINSGQAAILGVGQIRSVLARADGEIVDRRLMTLRASCDHRILYGADAAQFLSEIRDLLEQPLRLML